MTARVILLSLLLAVCAEALAAPDGPTALPKPTASLTYDNTAFIDANQIFMFVTNTGIIGRDLDGFFGYGQGTFWPYLGDTSLISANIDGAGDKTPLWTAGLWLGGVDHFTGDTLVTVAEYSAEYVPGPMESGWPLPDDPSFKVYKLYVDSLASNPNDDYLNWPADQGAPVDAFGRPRMLGRQMLWSVFNDADPTAHTNGAGSTGPLGIEVQQLVWAGDELGNDTIFYGQVFPVQRFNSSGLDIEVTAWIVDREALTGDEYQVIFDDTVHTVEIPETTDGNTLDTLAFYAWHLNNLTTAERVLAWQWPDSTSEAVEGFRVQVNIKPYGFANFEVVANNAGVLDPPEAGAAGWAGFPVPLDEYGEPKDPTSLQQATADAKWLFHRRGLYGETSSDFDAFVDWQAQALPVMQFYDYEIRFTGDNSNPEVNGSWAYDYTTADAMWVPFELWQTGIATPDNTDDDLRLVPLIRDGGVSPWGGDGTFALANWGSEALANCVGYCDHAVSDGDDDPFTDYIHWCVPYNESPGQAGYLAAEAELLAGTLDPHDLYYNRAALIHTVLVSWDGGVEPPFEQDCPEQGTVFRITTLKPDVPTDVFTFVTDQPPFYLSTLEGSSIYIQYKLYNKGDKTIDSVYVGFWSDPELGYAGDNLVGCDTLYDIWLCYNSDNDDAVYGTSPPAMGFKLLFGPVVPAPGQTAYFDGADLPDHRNLDMTAFVPLFDALDPENYWETYGYFRGLTKTGTPYVYDGDTLTFQCSGDPVAGTGDLDFAPASRRMMASSGPFDMAPGDSQYVLIKMGVAQGPDNLLSIIDLGHLLNEPFDPMTDVNDGRADVLPNRFHVRQNYPNPFNPATRIDYTLPSRARVTIDIYNILGQRVRRLVDETKPAGEHFVIWDGTDESSRKVSSGLYFYCVRAGDSVDSKKMLLLK